MSKWLLETYNEAGELKSSQTFETLEEALKTVGEAKGLAWGIKKEK